MIEVGTKFAVVYELVRPATTGEPSPFGAEVDNRRGNLWWARPAGISTGPDLLVCFDNTELASRSFEAARWLERKETDGRKPL